MTASPGFTDVTPSPTDSTIAPASWPRIDGKRPSGSEPSSVYRSVWQIAFATTLRRTSPAFGGATTMSVSRTSSTPNATTALHAIGSPLPPSVEIVSGRDDGGDAGRGRHDDAPLGGEQHAQPLPCADVP